MNKNIFVIVLITILSLYSCSNDNEEKYNLNGTTWFSGKGTIEFVTLKFYSSTFNMNAIYDYNLDGITDNQIDLNAKYKIDGNNVIFIRDDEEEYGIISEDGQTITISSEDTYLKFKKQ